MKCKTRSWSGIRFYQLAIAHVRYVWPRRDGTGSNTPSRGRVDYLAYGGCCFGLDRNLKYNKITIKNSYFISLLVGLSGPRLKKKVRVKQHKFTALQNTQRARNRHYFARTHSDGSCRKIRFILCQMIH